MAIIYAYQDRGITKDLTIVRADGTFITPGTNDVIRVIIGREGKLGVDNADAQLVVASDVPTTAGSTFTKGGGSSAEKNRLRLDASDLNFAAGIYTLFFDYFDNADLQEFKNVSREVFILEST